MGVGEEREIKAGDLSAQIRDWETITVSQAGSGRGRGYSGRGANIRKGLET